VLRQLSHLHVQRIGQSDTSCPHSLSSYIPEKLTGRHHPDLEGFFIAGKVPLIIGYHGIASCFHCQLEHHVILRVAQKGTPQKKI
jgi:hypothetical protein